jgi:hypothetical protein
MSAISVITSLMPLVQSAASVIQSFQGDAKAASTNSAIADAAEVLSVVAPLVESFSRGIEVSPEEVREALVGMDQALDAFDAEIQKQGG